MHLGGVARTAPQEARMSQAFRPLLALALMPLVLAGACGRPPAPRAGDLDLPFKELMDHVVQPAAFAVWRGAGFKATLKGEQDLSPRDDEGWTAVENGAATVAEAGKLLKLDGRVRAPDAAWSGWADALTRAGLAAKAAAEARNEDRVFEAGVRLEAVCSGCHAQFMPGGEGGPPVTPPPRRSSEDPPHGRGAV